MTRRSRQLAGQGYSRKLQLTAVQIDSSVDWRYGWADGQPSGTSPPSGHSQAEQSRAEQSRAEQSRAEQSRAEQSRGLKGCRDLEVFQARPGQATPLTAHRPPPAAMIRGAEQRASHQSQASTPSPRPELSAHSLSPLESLHSTAPRSKSDLQLHAARGGANLGPSAPRRTLPAV
ncbi:hypothetical protein N431DRAFT_49245 [Stipitochalara longipes BDJ]|nr:hypothetical protein N431DRAFT_49245 [Stipitochalara longipes BDJ]